MQLELCCSTPDLVWKTRPIGKRFADQYVCTCCDTVHRTEQWFAPLAWRSRADCINCGARGQAFGTCNRCQSTLTKSLTLHHKLIRLSPDLDACKGAQIAFDAGRNLLCLKLATISLYQNPENDHARLLRDSHRTYRCSIIIGAFIIKFVVDYIVTHANATSLSIFKVIDINIISGA